MKQLFVLLLAICLPAIARAQVSPTVTNGKSELTLVVPAPATQDELFVRGKDWVYRTYNSGKTVEQFDDKAAGHIAVKAKTLPLDWKVGLGMVNDAGAFTYNLTLDFKEGKARMLIDNIIYKQGETSHSMGLKSGADLGADFPDNWPTLGKKSMLKHWNEMQASTNYELKLLAESFQQAMTKQKSDF